jgi:hypothetical protein
MPFHVFTFAVDIRNGNLLSLLMAFLNVWSGKMRDAKPKMPKVWKTLGYVPVLAKGLPSLQQPLQNVKVVAVCMDCFQRKNNGTC